MGIGGLGNAWSLSHQAFGTPLIVGQILLILAAIVFIALIIAHLAKLGFHLSAVIEEFVHPIRSSFFPACSVAFLVLAIGARPYSTPLAEVLWWPGAALHLIFAVTLVRRWMVHCQDESVVTPAWFIPVVGNILVPVGGVPLGYVEISWFFFSIGLVFWLVFFTIVLHRVLFLAPMSDRSVPTLFILLAPPSIGLSAYMAFTGGGVGPLADILYSLALFIAILLLTMWRHVSQGAFFMSWWAMTFPTDGWAGATLAYYRARPEFFTAAVAVFALGAATILVMAIAWRTLMSVAAGTAFRED
jgi:tellurite resistance protein